MTDPTASTGLSLRDRIIVALDKDDAAEALEVARALQGRAAWVKVGLTLYCTAGPSIAGTLRDMGFEVFVDLKLHDIPHQVEGAARVLGALGARMFTVHASGGQEMIAAAVKGAGDAAAEAGLPRPSVLAVTVLTSLSREALARTGVEHDVADHVARLASLARDAGADGVVCSPQETAAVRKILGEGPLVVTPGVRPPWAEAGDQARIATPAEALAAGASFLVVGRPITAADDPAASFDRLVSEERASSGLPNG